MNYSHFIFLPAFQHPFLETYSFVKRLTTYESPSICLRL